MDRNPCQCRPRCNQKVKTVDGVRMLIPTWCNTPQSWNPSGSWMDSPEIYKLAREDARRVCDIDALEAILNNHPVPSNSTEMCTTYWGSHGCSLDQGHGGVWHVCDPEGGEACMAVMEWGEGNSVIAWQVDGEREEWQPWGMHWEKY